MKNFLTKVKQGLIALGSTAAILLFILVVMSAAYDDFFAVYNHAGTAFTSYENILNK